VNKQFWIINAAKDKAEIYLYGYIGYEEQATASYFVKELKELEKNYSKIDLHINSGGGSVFEGLAIINAIKTSKAEITGYIDGIAASMASIIALSLKSCYMSKYARLMTHRVTGGCYGNADELRAQADQCESLENDLVEIISIKTGLTAEQVRDQYITNQDKWITAAEAERSKLITGIVDGALVEVPENMKTVEELYNIYSQAINATIIQNPIIAVI